MRGNKNNNTTTTTNNNNEKRNTLLIEGSVFFVCEFRGSASTNSKQQTANSKYNILLTFIRFPYE